MMAPFHARKAVRLAEKWVRAAMKRNGIEALSLNVGVKAYKAKGPQPLATIVNAGAITFEHANGSASSEIPITWFIDGDLTKPKRPILLVWLRDLSIDGSFWSTAVRVPKPLDADDGEAVLLAVVNGICAKAKHEAKEPGKN
jgi:hypothetical protein